MSIVYIYIYIQREREREGGGGGCAHGVMANIIENGHMDTSSSLGQSCLHFMLQ